MGQSQPFSAPGDSAWLSGLVDTLERVEQLHDEPCNEDVISAAMARLQRPATARRDVIRRGEVLQLTF